MADDASPFMQLAKAIVCGPPGNVVRLRREPFAHLVHSRDPAPVRTLFDSAHSFDSEAAGLPAPTPAEADGGLRIMLDARGKQLAVVITSGGAEVTITGARLIIEACTALMNAESAARKMVGGEPPSAPEAA